MVWWGAPVDAWSWGPDETGFGVSEREGRREGGKGYDDDDNNDDSRCWFASAVEWVLQAPNDTNYRSLRSPPLPSDVNHCRDSST